MSPVPASTPGRRRLPWVILAALLLAAGAFAWWSAAARKPAADAPASAVPPPGAKADASARPALTVTLTQPQREDWPRTLAAQGNIAAWQ